MNIVWMSFDYDISISIKRPIMDYAIVPTTDINELKRMYDDGYRIYDLTNINIGYNLGSETVIYIIENPDIIYPDVYSSFVSEISDEQLIAKKIMLMETLSTELRVLMTLKYGI